MSLSFEMRLRCVNIPSLASLEGMNTTPPLVQRLRRFDNTIFDEMTELARRHRALNLGQGTPEDPGPRELLDAASAALLAGDNQYAPGRGTAELRAAVAEHQRRWYGVELDPETEVVITAGATEAMTAAILSLVEPGDEAIAFEPIYDCYDGALAMAGATLVPVRLDAPSYRLDVDRLRDAIGPRTRFLILNTPHNPTGHVFDRDELQAIAEVVQEHDLFVLSDDVYEHLTFDDHRHIPIATLPQMADRTLTISSAGKTFSVTGWKIGWMTGPADVLTASTRAKQNMTFTNGTPLQHGVAVGLGLPPQRFDELRIDLQNRRDLLTRGLEDIGFTVHPSQGTYFVTADASALVTASGRDDLDGLTLCRHLPELVGVAAIPSQVFYVEPDASVRMFVRFTSSRSRSTLTAGLERLASLPDKLKEIP